MQARQDQLGLLGPLVQPVVLELLVLLADQDQQDPQDLQDQLVLQEDQGRLEFQAPQGLKGLPEQQELQDQLVLQVVLDLMVE